MKKTSLLALILVLALCLPLLTACGGDKGEEETSAIVSHETTVGNEETTASKETTKAPEQTTVITEETYISCRETTETTESTETTGMVEAPEATETTQLAETTEAPEATETSQVTETTQVVETTEMAETVEATETTVIAETTELTESTEETTENPITGEVINGYYVSGDKSYQLYYFDEYNADRYAQGVMNIAVELAGLAQVYSIIAPTSAVIYLSDREIEALKMSSGKEGIEYINHAIATYSDQLIASGKITLPVQTISLYDCLSSHRDEYIYYRTDHHWAALGAYYASRYFLDTVGKSYPSLDEYKEIRIDNFLGTHYNHTQSANLGNNPDTVYAYESSTVTKFNVLYSGATAFKEKPIINPNVTSWNKYLCFITGDRPYSIIHNETITDGSSILLIKDSFGNAFAPMILDSYEYVYIIDYRHWVGDLAASVQETNVETVLLLTNIMSTASDTSLNNLDKFLKPE